MLELKMKMISSLEKCFWNDTLESKKEVKDFAMFRNQRLSFQVAYRAESDEMGIQRDCVIRIGGAIAKYAKIRLVSNVLNMFPTYNVNPGGAFTRTTPGAYPDMLRPLIYPDKIALPSRQTHALWIDIELPTDFAAGEYEFTLGAYVKDVLLSEVSARICVLEAELPSQTMIHTEWFYTDCIANYYHCKAFSERHWRIIENYMRVAVRNGINMILTPVFTPELDTYIGGERLTTQLVDIELSDSGKYIFGFEKLHRWIDLCLSVGIEYFEIPHFFTQWGAKAAPKIIVKVNGRKKKYFGWHTDSMGEEYGEFLGQFIPALVNEFKFRGLDKKCYFHVSDEPNLKQLEQYQKCKDRIAKYLKGYPIIDALSDIDFYATGILENPVPNTRHAMAFVKANVPDLWVYYCGGGKDGTSDRSIAMPTERTRILGIQLYYYDIVGFLHWGYNFYNSCRSYTALDPYGYTDGSYFTPSGDCFLVYPGTDGEAWESLRLNALREAMDDIRALKWYESKFGKDAAKRLITEEAGSDITFTEYPTDPDYITNIRARIAKAAESI